MIMLDCTESFPNTLQAFASFAYNSGRAREAAARREKQLAPELSNIDAFALFTEILSNHLSQNSGTQGAAPIETPVSSRKISNENRNIIQSLFNSTEDLYVKPLVQKYGSNLQLVQSRQVGGTSSALTHSRIQEVSYISIYFSARFSQTLIWLLERGFVLRTTSNAGYLCVVRALADSLIFLRTSIAEDSGLLRPEYLNPYSLLALSFDGPEPKMRQHGCLQPFQKTMSNSNLTYSMFASIVE